MVRSFISQQITNSCGIFTVYRLATSGGGYKDASCPVELLRIGVAAGYGLILAAVEANRLAVPFSEQLSTFYEWSEELKETRPTAINLAWAVNRIIAIVKAGPFASMHEIIDRITHEAIVIHEEDVQLNTRMAINGATLFKGKQNLRILTHCNAGALATGGLGTALGVIRKLHEQGQLEMVYADETRPLLQGAV